MFSDVSLVRAEHWSRWRPFWCFLFRFSPAQSIGDWSGRHKVQWFNPHVIPHPPRSESLSIWCLLFAFRSFRCLSELVSWLGHTKLVLLAGPPQAASPQILLSLLSSGFLFPGPHRVTVNFSSSSVSQIPWPRCWCTPCFLVNTSLLLTLSLWLDVSCRVRLSPCFGS